MSFIWGPNFVGPINPKRYLKSHKCIYLTQWATLVSFWALCEKFTQFWIALIFGTLSSSSCRPAWAFFAAYRVKQIFDVPNSKLFSFFSVSVQYTMEGVKPLLPKKWKKKTDVLLILNLASILRCEKIILDVSLEINEIMKVFHLFLKIDLE